MLIEKLQEKVSEITNSPGIYIMKSSGGVVIYVGKAKNLRNRLASYFNDSEKDIKTTFLVSKIDDFEIIATKTEAEALILECNLIKKYSPKYNILLKDDKRFPSLKLDFRSHDFPKFEVIRKVDAKPKYEVFGPYTNIKIWNLIKVINRIFQLRDCSDKEFTNRIRPCIRFEIKHCHAPCVGLCSKEKYKELLNDAKLFLKGDKDALLTKLKDEMLDFSEKLMFEEAARIRDSIDEIQNFETKQSIENRIGDVDVLSLIIKDRSIRGTILKLRAGNIEETEHIKFKIEDHINFTNEEALANFIGQYYLNDITEIPEKILIPFEPQGYEELKQAILEKINSKLIIGSTEKDKDLLTFALKNTSVQIEDNILGAIAYDLNLIKLPRRIECYDNSHLQGTNPVASRVCFIDGAPSKENYRHYHIRTVTDGDDFAMMREVLFRRFSKVNVDNSESDLPDLLVVDGGKGQLAQAVAVLEELKINIEVVSLAKARSRKGTEERIFKPNRKNPILLKPNSQTFKVLVHLRDEAHRFAINFHRETRDKKNWGKN